MLYWLWDIRCAPLRFGLVSVRAAWCLGNLNNNGNAGLAARNSNNGTGNSNWNGVVGVPSGYQSLVRLLSLHRIFLAYVLKLPGTSTAGDGPSQMGIACGSGIRNPLAASSIGITEPESR